MNTAEFIWSCAQCHAAPELIDPRVAAAWPELLFWDKFHFLHDLGWRHAWLHGGKQIVKLPIARMRSMSGEEMKSYDRQVADFFRLSLP